MKQERNSTQTRQRILNAGTRHFSKEGFKGASTDAIVRAARVNKRMLYHYFGDKQGLFKEVLAAQWAALSQSVVTATGQSPLPPLEAATHAAFDFLGTHPEFVRLVMWEGLAGGKSSRSLWKQVRGPVASMAMGLLPGNDEQRRQLLVSLLGAISFYFAFASTLGDLLGEDPLAPAALARRKAHLVEMMAAVSRPV